MEPGDKSEASLVPPDPSPIKMRMKAALVAQGSQDQGVEMPPPPPRSTTSSSLGLTSPPAGTSTVQRLAASQQGEMSVEEYLELTKPCKYQIGDLIWAKLTGHPWWPCMVTEDPLMKVHTKLTGKGLRTYHCQFFGKDAERSWVAENSTMVFEGREAFLQFVENTINAAGTKAQRKQACQKYEIKPSKRQAWDLSALTADQALMLDIEERKKVYTFRYRDLPPDVSLPATSPGASSNAEPAITLPSPAKPASAVKRVRTASASEKKTKKSKFTSLKSGQSAATSPSRSVVSQQSLDDSDPFAFDDSDVLSPPPSMTTPSKTKSPASGILSPTGSRMRQLSSSSSTSTTPVRATAARRSSTASASSTSTTPSKPKKTKSTVTNKVGEIQTVPVIFDIQRLTSTSSIRKDSVCLLCERSASQSVDNGEVVQCTGACMNSYHTVCASISNKENFKCSECVSGVHQCFICKASDNAVIQCSVKDCGKYYHKRCLQSHPLVYDRDKESSFQCPLHLCASCARGDANNEKAHTGKLFKCIRCPTAYHTGELCIAAGSAIIGGNHIICVNHFQKEKSNKYHHHINVTWCFTCGSGGTLVCCDSCPAAFHRECLTGETILENDVWHCNDCRCGIRPRYGDIVWVKLGAYRWWPSEICHPEHVPLNIQQKSHKLGEFAVHFLGSNDYNWMHRGRVFLYADGDKGSKESTSGKNLNKMFKNALREAVEGYKQVKLVRENKEQQIAKICDSRPKKYKYIKVNLPIPPVTMNRVDKEQIAVCECRGFMENPCGDDEICLNRMLYYECHPATCPAGELCQNQRFQKKLYPKQEPFRTGDERGWGLKAKVDIKKGQFVNEYVGELIDDEECKRRIEKYHSENLTTFYMLTLDTNRVIDAGPKGNLARFANHSCDPNMQTQKWCVNGNWRIGLFATKDIPAGTELTFNYNLVSVGETKLKCLCKATSCSGFIGDRLSKPVQVNGGDKQNKPRKRKRQVKLKHEDLCFRCLDGGELVMCNRKNCTKAYHLGCLKLEKVPKGKWDCPWHHCDICGRNATALCVDCPASFCAEHAPSNIQVVQGVTFCLEHQQADIEQSLAELASNARNPANTTPNPNAPLSISTGEISQDAVQQSAIFTRC